MTPSGREGGKSPRPSGDVVTDILTVADALAIATRRLAATGVPEPRREARLLIAHAIAGDAAAVLGYPERRLDPAESNLLEAILERRSAREPLARIIGEREFWSLSFRLSPATLDPRPDSETLVAAVLRRLPDRRRQFHFLDLGTGTGCLLLALLSELPNSYGIGVDIAAGAVATARSNAKRLGLGGRASFLVGSWGNAIAGRFDVIVANPPYIESATIGGLAPEVAEWEPRLALDGGADGLQAYRAIAGDLGRLLRLGGTVALEIGGGQAMAVAAILNEWGLVPIDRAHDLAGVERCLLFGDATPAKPPEELGATKRWGEKTVGKRRLPV